MPLPLGRQDFNSLMRNDDRTEELLRRLQAVAAITADPPLVVSKSDAAYHIAFDRAMPVLVKIQGRANGYSGNSYGNNWPANYYIGVQVRYDLNDEPREMYGGQVFSNRFPLVEVSGDENVAVGTYHYAWPGNTYDHYEFKNAAGGSSTSSTVRLCYVAGNPQTSGAIRYYPCYFNELDVPSDSWLGTTGPLEGDVYDCWLVQRLDYDLTVTSDYGPGIYTGLLQTGTKSLGGYTLPVYATTDAPFLSPECEVHN